MEVAKTRKQIELQNVQQRAVEQNQRIEDTMFINKLTKENQKLDLDEKMSETEERRRQILNSRVTALKQQREAADYKRLQLDEEN